VALGFVRFVFRTLAIVALAVAVIMAVLDVTRSVASGAPVLTPLAESWAAAAPAMLSAAEELATRHLPAFFWNPLMQWVLTQPGFAVLAAVSLMFYLLGRRWRKPDILETV
jgi:hypothetical protein